MRGSAITICIEDEDTFSADINLCLPEEDPTDPDINLCIDREDSTEEEAGPCTKAATLSVAGDESVEVDGTYSGAGGIPPYTYSISCGSIDTDGKVTDLTGCCGTGSVSVSDSCGNSASLEVRFPSGVWEWASFAANCDNMTNPDGTYKSNNALCTGTDEYCYTCEVISGGTKTEHHWGLYTGALTCGGSDCYTCTSTDGSCHQDEDPCGNPRNDTVQCIHYSGATTWTWECP